MKKRKIFGKRMVVLAVLIIALSAAVYLNWRYSVQNGNFDLSAFITQQTTEKYLGNAQYVNAGVGTTGATNFFEKTKTERDTTREDSLETLQEVIDSVKATETAKNEAAAQITKLTQLTENETSIETLVKAKGFKNSVAVITDESVTVVVKTDENGLLDSETAQIQDIIASTVKISIENIKIIEVK